MPPEIIKTADGSHTLFVPELNEHYHSTFGAISESRHIFIESGLKQVIHDIEPLCILEIGFGTGLNALLTLVEAEKYGKTVHYTSIEPFPLPSAMVKQLNYPEILGGTTPALFKILHEAEWNREIPVAGHFLLKKVQSHLEKTELNSGCFDLVFFDAFGPDVQPGLWTETIFRKIFLSLKDGGILVTYSVKGAVRRALKGAGFSVEKIPGPEGKREITRAIRYGDKQV